MLKLLTYIFILINLCEEIYCTCIVYEGDFKHLTCRSERLSLINSILDKESYEILTIEDPVEKIIPTYGIEYPSLIELQIINIKEIHSNAFENLGQLEKLKISDSPELTTLSKDALNNLEAEYLKINGTNLETIEHGAFDKCFLIELDLSFNRILSIKSGLFDHLIGLEILNLRSNNIQNLPSSIFKTLENLEHLDLSSNQLSYLPDEVFQIEECILENINLANNNIEHISENLFKGLSFLKTLNLSQNKMKTIGTNAFETCKDLENLDLSGNSFGSNVSRKDFDYLPALNTLSLDPIEQSNTTESTVILGTDDSSTTKESSINLVSTVTPGEVYSEKIDDLVTEQVDNYTDKINISQQTETTPTTQETELFTSNPKDSENTKDQVSTEFENEITTSIEQEDATLHSIIETTTTAKQPINIPSIYFLPPIIYDDLLPPKDETNSVQIKQIPTTSPVQGRVGVSSGYLYPTNPISETADPLDKEIYSTTTQKTANIITTSAGEIYNESVDNDLIEQRIITPSSNPLLPPYQTQDRIGIVTNTQNSRTLPGKEFVSHQSADINSTPTFVMSNQDVTITPKQEDNNSKPVYETPLVESVNTPSVSLQPPTLTQESLPIDINKYSSSLPSVEDRISGVTNSQTPKPSSIQVTIDDRSGNVNPFPEEVQIPLRESINAWREKHQQGTLLPSIAIQGILGSETDKLSPTISPIQSEKMTPSETQAISDDDALRKPSQEKDVNNSQIGSGFYTVPVLISGQPNKQITSKPAQESINAQNHPTVFAQEAIPEDSNIPSVTSEDTINDLTTINVQQTANQYNFSQSEEETTNDQTEISFSDLETTTINEIYSFNVDESINGQEPHTASIQETISENSSIPLIASDETENYFPTVNVQQVLNHQLDESNAKQPVEETTNSQTDSNETSAINENTQFNVQDTSTVELSEHSGYGNHGNRNEFEQKPEILPVFPTEIVITQKPNDNTGGCLKQRAHWDFVNKTLFYVCLIYKFIAPQ